jgi:cyclic lactone autoinducer peptide
MFRKIQLMALSTMAIMLTFIATANVSSFKWFIIYEPEVPEGLK